MDGPGRALIVKLGAIGDVVMTIPAAHALHCRGYQVEWVCGMQVLPLLERYPWIRAIGVEERVLFEGSAAERARALLGVWRAVAGRRYALCATLYYDWRYRAVSLPVRAERRVVLSHTDRARRLLPGRHHTDEYLRVMLGEDAGPVPVGLAPVVLEGLPASPRGRVEGTVRVVLVPGGARNVMRSDALRRWPVERYVEVARGLLERGYEVVLVGSAEDRWTVESFAGMDVVDLVGSMTLLETVALMRESDAVVTHDTGPLHLAGLTGVGIVSVFGPTDPHGRLPQRVGAVAVWGGEGFACRPCYDGREYARCGENQCVRQVTAAMVLDEVKMLLEQRQAGSMAAPRVVLPVSTVTAGMRGVAR